MRWSARALALVLALSARGAEANGRNAQTVGIWLNPSDAQSIYVSTTFGFLQSHDGGCAFNWMCEQSIGYGGTWDPRYSIATDGTIFATTFEGLRVSRDSGCSFATAPGTEGLWIDALSIGSTGEIWIGIAQTGGVNDVMSSHDNGASFQSKGLQSPEVWYKSVVSAPSNPARVYATGYQVANTPAAYLYRSDNGGATWTPSPLTGVTYGGTPVIRVQAIDPINPDVLYMTSEAANPPAGDRLYRSTDGGQTFTEVVATAALVHDVVIRDATHVLVATQLRTASSLVGGPTYQSTDGGATFAPMTGTPQLACLAQASDGTLYGCGANWEPDFKAIAKSLDGGVTWEKQWRFAEMNDAVQCEAGTVQHDTCDVMLWDCPTCGSDLKRQFTAKGPTCGPYATDTPVPKKASGGCCGAGDPVGAVWALVVGLTLGRRRRRASSANAS